MPDYDASYNWKVNFRIIEVSGNYNVGYNYVSGTYSQSYTFNSAVNNWITAPSFTTVASQIGYSIPSGYSFVGIGWQQAQQYYVNDPVANKGDVRNKNNTTSVSTSKTFPNAYVANNGTTIWYIVKDVSGKLKISKSFSGLDSSETTPSVNVTVNNKVYTLSSDNNYTQTISLPAGTYTVTENTSSAAVSGYTLDTNHSTTTQRVTVTAGQTATAALSNVYTKDINWDRLTITKTVNKTAAKAGDTVTYTITVKNNTGKDLTNLTVSDQLNNNLTYSNSNASTGTYNNSSTGVWSIDSLSNGSTATLTINATVNNGASGQISNTASITGAKNGNEDIPYDKKKNDTATVNVEEEKGSLTVSKTFEGLDEGASTPNVTVTVNNQEYTLSSENNYTQTISNLSTGTYTVSEKTNSTAVTGYTLDTDKSTTSQTVTVEADKTATATLKNVYTKNVDWSGLTITKDANKSSVKAGDDIAYTITVKNNTGKDLTGVTVSDKLDNHLTYQSNSTESGTYDNGTGVWTIGSLNNGAAATLTINATVNKGASGTISNKASLTGAKDGNEDIPDKSKPEATRDVTVEPEGSLTISKTFEGLADGTAKPEITVTLSDEDRSEEKTVKLSSENDYTATVDGLSLGSYTVTERTDTAAVDGYTLDTDKSITTDTVSVTQEKSVTAELKNVYTKNAEPAPDWSKLSITKTASPTGTVNAGDAITYTLTVTNHTGKDLTNVNVTDQLDSKLAFTKADGDGSYDSTTGIWTIDSLKSDASAKLSITANVKEDATGKIANSATINGASSGENTLPEDVRPGASVDVTVNTNPEPQPKPETKYTITYTDGVDNEVIFEDQAYTVNNGDKTPTFNGTPTRKGYTFAGWSPALADTVSGNVTYTATWKENGSAPVTPDEPKKNQYTITYTDGVDNEVIFEDQTYTVNDGDKTPTFNGTPTRKGYVFAGWNPAVADTVTKNATYTAVWKVDANGNGIPDDQENVKPAPSNNTNNNSGNGSSGSSSGSSTSTTSPSTGDNSHVSLYLTLMIIAAAGIATAVILGRRSRRS